ncbi:MAG: ribonuclease P protein component [Myxococcota bacterium]
MRARPGRPTEGLPKTRRLLRRRDFTRVQGSRAKHRTSHFVLLAAPGTGPHERLGIVASRRAGNAVARNRSKRLVREWFRRCAGPRPVDIVVILRPSAHELSAERASAELDEARSVALKRLSRQVARAKTAQAS